MHRTHGMRGSAEYRIWTGIKTRCTNPRSVAYPPYGGRGIRLDARWMRFEYFYADMGPRPTPRHSIDRIDGNGHYTPGNCRWATPEEQARNKQRAHRLTIGGETKSLAQWAEVARTPLKRIWDRLTAGWTPAAAVFTAKRPDRPATCHNGHLLDETSRFEGRSRRCTICKKAYDSAYRQRTQAPLAQED